jgi:hypothetical protein
MHVCLSPTSGPLRNITPRSASCLGLRTRRVPKMTKKSRLRSKSGFLPAHGCHAKNSISPRPHLGVAGLQIVSLRLDNESCETLKKQGFPECSMYTYFQQASGEKYIGKRRVRFLARHAPNKSLLGTMRAPLISKPHGLFPKNHIRERFGSKLLP